MHSQTSVTGTSLRGPPLRDLFDVTMSDNARMEAIQVGRRFDASAERAFDAWLDPERASKFLFATPTGVMVRTDIDARVGGRFCLLDRRDGVDVEHVGTYLEIDRPRRLAFEFGAPQYSAEFTRVVIELTTTDAGCELTLTHHGVLAEYSERTRQGWRGILEGLARAL
jgi:uncharacterized protein YndB with AHSA1/START domain